jgi:acyl-CoA thioesterase
LSEKNIEMLRDGSTVEPLWRFLGIQLVEIGEGYAKASLKLKPEFLNFAGLVHGGIIMTLADSVFGYAVNTLHFPTVACQFNTHLLAPPMPDDELFAECRVVKQGKRMVMAEISVEDQSGKLIARATGTSIPLER